MFFAALYTYAVLPTSSGGGLRWYAIQPQSGFSSNFTEANVDLYKPNFTDPRFATPLCTSGNCSIPPLVVQATGKLKFTTCNDLELKIDAIAPGSDFPPDLNEKTIRMRRPQSVGTCQENLQLVGQVEANKTNKCATSLFRSGLGGTWQYATANWSVDPQHAGRGLLIDVNSGNAECQGGYMFVGWYDYRGAGDALADKPRWLTLQGFSPQAYVQGQPRKFNGFAYATYGGALALPMPNPTNASIGTANIEFLDCNRAVLTYSFPGSPTINGYTGIVGSAGTVQLIRTLPRPGCVF